MNISEDLHKQQLAYLMHYLTDTELIQAANRYLNKPATQADINAVRANRELILLVYVKPKGNYRIDL